MSIEFTIDILEQKQDKLFVTGLSLNELAVDDCFTALHQYGNSKKSKKRLSELNLCVESIILDGEPVDSVRAQQSAMLILLGDATALLDAIDALRWRKKSGRFIRTSQEALTLADS
ncbi:MAG: hypothetical protein AAF846_17320 [Chloroflexota bacterium]